MKCFRNLVIALLIIFITGCNNNELTSNYNNMLISPKGIDSYRLDLRVYGMVNDNYINDTIKIMGNSNKEYEIKITTIKNNDVVGKIETNYIKNNKVYIKGAKGYVVAKENIKYSNPTLYLEGIKNIKKINKKRKEEIGEYLYSVYEITIKKDYAKQLLESTTVSEINVDKDIYAKVYIDKDEYIYRIIYYIDNITINANYYGINVENTIMMPTEIK